jgi:hypothetical protein
MGCFNNLVKSTFLKNALNELAEAKQKLEYEQVEEQNNLSFLDVIDRKIGYKLFVRRYEIFEYVKEELTTRLIEDKHLGALLIQIDDKHDGVIFCFSANINTIKKVINHYYNTDGILPYHCGKHRLLGRTIHTVLLNVKTTYPPTSLN